MAFFPEKSVDVTSQADVEIKFKAGPFVASQVLPPVTPIAITPESAESAGKLPSLLPLSESAESDKEALTTLKKKWISLYKAHAKLPTALQALAVSAIGARPVGSTKHDMSAMEGYVIDQMRNDVLAVSSLEIKEAEDAICASISQVAAIAQSDLLVLLYADKNLSQATQILLSHVDELGKRVVYFTNVIREINETSEFVQSLKDAWDAAVKKAEMAKAGGGDRSTKTTPKH